MFRDTDPTCAFQAEKADEAWSRYADLAKRMAADPQLRGSKMMRRLRDRAFNTFLERYV